MDATPQSGWRWSDAVPRRPVLAAAVLLMAGIFTHRAIPAEPRTWLWIAIALAVTAIACIRREIACAMLIGGSMVLVGAALAQQSAYFYWRNEIGLFAGDEPRLAQIEVVIEDPPRVISADRPYPGPNQERQVTRGRVVRVLTRDAGWERASGVVLLNLSEPLKELRVNQRLRLTGMLHRPARALNPGQFDWANCALADGANVVRAAFWTSYPCAL